MTIDKSILVVPRDFIIPMFGAVPVLHDALAAHLVEHAIAADRSAVEGQGQVKQIIPYVIVRAGVDEFGDGRILAGVRLGGGNENRLHGRITIGFGGHVQFVDGQDPMEAILESVRIELEEELGIGQDFFVGKQLKVVAILNDETTQVGTDHLGLVVFVDMAQEDDWFALESKEPDKLKVFWTSMGFLGSLENRMEEWSHLAASFIHADTQRQIAEYQRQQREQPAKSVPLIHRV